MIEAAEKALKVLSTARYADVRILRQRTIRVALRGDSAEQIESSSERIICRCVARGYGVASTDLKNDVDGEALGEKVLRCAMTVESPLHLAEVKVEKGEKEWTVREEFNVERTEELLLGIKDLAYDYLKNADFRLEAVATFTFTDNIFMTSEGTMIREVTPLTDLVAYFVVRQVGEGFSGFCLGGVGGLETLTGWENVVEETALKALDSSRAKLIPPTLKWRKQTVILDCVASGALAHEIAHMLEGDLYTGRQFSRISLPEGFTLIDDPLINGGYGTFQWDDEGVRAKRKILLSSRSVNFLHTRFSAPSGEEAGNARGIDHKPRPMMSNVYIKPLDWGPREMLEETREGIYVKAVSVSYVTPFDGLLRFTPEVAYVVKRGEIKPVKGVAVVGLVPSLISAVDAIGKDLHLRPNIEKGINICEGGPHVRIRECRIT